MTTKARLAREKSRLAWSRHDRAGFAGGRTALFIVAIFIGFALAFLGLTYVPKIYGSWRESRLIARANTLLQQQNLEEAARTAKKILLRYPDSIAALHVLAETTEKQNSAETIQWRSRIAHALSHNLEAQLNLASAALRFGELDTARRALENVAEAERDTAAYHVVAGWLARAQGNEKDVEAHFAAALKQEPQNDLYQYNLAVLRIRSAEPEPYDEARATLERLSKVPSFRAGSLRALLSDAVERDDLERADTLAQGLQMTQQVTFADYLLCLDFYRKLDEKKFLAVLDKIKPVAARNERDLARLMDWMIRNGRASEVLKWSEKLPPEITSVPPSAVAIAEALSEVKNWPRLKKWTSSGTWYDAEYLRHAYHVYASRQTKPPIAEAEFAEEWRTAESDAAANSDRELNLARLATKWNLSVESEQLWLRVAKNPPMRREALDSLAYIYRTRDDLRRLLEVSKELHESSPREPILEANYARLFLLLEPSTDEAQRKAKEAYDAAPGDVTCAITYAFALHILGRAAEGLEILKKIPSKQLLDSHSAVYAVVMYAGANQIDAATEFIAAAKEGPLFPEERNLFEEALSKAAAATPVLTPAPPETTPIPTPSKAPGPPAPMSSNVEGTKS